MVKWRGGVGGATAKQREKNAREWDLAVGQHVGLARDYPREGASAV